MKLPLVEKLRGIALNFAVFLFLGCENKQEEAVETGGEVAVEEQTYLLTSTDERQLMDHRLEAFDPKNDGWESEYWHERTNQVLKDLGSALTGGGEAGSFVSGEGQETKGDWKFRPGDTLTSFDSEGIQVFRAKKSEHRLRGGELRAALMSLGEDVNGGWCQFKQFEIEGFASESSNRWKTKVFVKFGWTSEGREVIQEMKWRVDWRVEGDEPRVVGVVVEDWQESSKEGLETWFEDRSSDVLGHLLCYPQQLRIGANDWVERISGDSGRRLQGIAVGDLNGDGLDDVFCPQAEGLPNRVLVSGPQGTLRDLSREWGLDWLDETLSALILDFDNDGDQDLAIGTSDCLVFVRNEGRGKGFVRGQSFVQEDCSALCSADFDGDGLLDLFVGNYLGVEKNTTVTKPEHVYNATNGSLNHLYRNDGNFEFAEVTEEVGMSEGADRLVFAGSWEDFDQDGDPDLYVANDFGRNCLYINEGGRFVERAKQFGVDDPSTGMSVSWGDPNGDGRMDLIVGNMFSAAGNRVTTQSRFRDELSSDLSVERVRYLARGNALLLNAADRFEESSQAAGVLNSQWTWSLLFTDINNDGWEDALALNGYVTGREADDL